MSSSDIILSIGIIMLSGLSILRNASLALSLPVECESGKMTTPTYGDQGAVFTVCASINIPTSATSSQVYDILIDFNKYNEWNTFVTSVDLPENVTSYSDVYVGMLMTFHTKGLVPGITTISNERITYLEPGAANSFAAWRFDPGVGIILQQAEHVSLVLATSDGVRHVSWETYYGLHAYLLSDLKENLNTQFQKQANDLRVKVQSLHP